MRRIVWITPLLTAAACLWTYLRNSTDPGVALSISAFAVVTAFVYALRAFRRQRQWAETHVLVVTDQELHFQDGPIELRVPFETVTSLVVKRRGSTVRALTLKYDSHREFLSRYENAEQLTQLLIVRIPPDRVKDFSWLHV